MTKIKLAHSELTNTIYAIVGREKVDITEQAIAEVRAIKALEQEPKTGHWIPIYGNVKCSVCGNTKDSRNVGKATHYCDYCGAKMEG